MTSAEASGLFILKHTAPKRLLRTQTAKSKFLIGYKGYDMFFIRLDYLYQLLQKMQVFYNIFGAITLKPYNHTKKSFAIFSLTNLFTQTAFFCVSSGVNLKTIKGYQLNGKHA